MLRTGLLFRKVGSTAVFDNLGIRSHVTLLRFDEALVVATRTEEIHGYDAVQIGSIKTTERKLSKASLGFFKKNNLETMAKIVEFRVSKDGMLNVGDKIGIDHFVVGQLVDVSSVSIGKGFAGVMKRYHYGGQCASHGTSLTHRSLGSTGQCQDPGKVWKGKKMAGRMGGNLVTMQNLKIMYVDMDLSLIAVAGGVPGKSGAYVAVVDAVKKNHNSFVLPFPGKLLNTKSFVDIDVVTE